VATTKRKTTRRSARRNGGEQAKRARSPAVPKHKPQLVMTRGRRSLIAILQRTTAREVAIRCRVSKQAVSNWQHGFKKPSAAARSMLQANYGISPNTWDEPFNHPDRAR
jgi:hypothetical protein